MIEYTDSNDLISLFKLYKDNYIISKNNYVKYLSYKKNNKIVAFLCYSNIMKEIEIIDAFVLEEYRRQNIMSELFMYIEEVESPNRILLEVSVNNSPAINLYKKLDFKIVSTRKKYYNGVDAYLMIKEMK